jgi:hypothetical protein
VALKTQAKFTWVLYLVFVRTVSKAAEFVAKLNQGKLELLSDQKVIIELLFQFVKLALVVEWATTKQMATAH